ncbi:MAG: SDR family NAD(P)-dependent oxidoreductase, partial [Gemmatimonadota bacterium]
MGDRVCLVTGATNGIGKVTARALAEAGSRVLIVARDRERGEATVSEIRSVSGNVRVELLLADLSRQADIRRLAAEVHARTDRLDVLVNNAGGFSVDRQLTVDG